MADNKKEEVLAEVPVTEDISVDTEVIPEDTVLEETNEPIVGEETILETSEDVPAEGEPALPETNTPEDTGGEDIQTLRESVLKFNSDAPVETNEDVIRAAAPIMQKMAAFNDDFMNIIEENPEFGEIIVSLKQGFSLPEAIAMNIDIDNLTPPEGAPDYDKVQEARTKRSEAATKRKEWEEMIPQNQELSSQNFSKVADELGLDEEARVNIVNKMENILTDAMDGTITEDNWRLLANGLRHDEVISDKDKEKEAAVEDAKIAGRNEQIEKKILKPKEGDGLPRLSGTTPIPEPDEGNDDLKDFRKLASRKSII